MIRRNRLILIASTLLSGALLAACGSAVTTGTGGGATSASSAGTGGTGTTVSTGVSIGDGGMVSCSTFAPPAPTPTPVSVRLFNKTAAPMYLGETTAGCNAPFGFTLADSGGAALRPSRDACEFTCGELQTGGCECPAGCGAPSVTMVAPGSYYEVPWTGTVFTSMNMPPMCFKDPTCSTASTTCLVEQSAPAGPLTMKASAYTTAKGCTPGPCLPCMPGGLGTCTVIGGQTVGGTELMGTAMWMGESKIEIDIQ